MTELPIRKRALMLISGCRLVQGDIGRFMPLKLTDEITLSCEPPQFFDQEHLERWAPAMGTLAIGRFRSPDFFIWIERHSLSSTADAVTIALENELALCLRAFQYIPSAFKNLSKVEAIVLSEVIGSDAGRGFSHYPPHYAARQLWIGPGSGFRGGSIDWKIRYQAHADEVAKIGAIYQGWGRCHDRISKCQSLRTAFRTYQRSLQEEFLDDRLELLVKSMETLLQTKKSEGATGFSKGVLELLGRDVTPRRKLVYLTIYELRNALVHGWRFLKANEARYVLMMEHVARTILTKVLTNEPLFHEIYERHKHSAEQRRGKHPSHRTTRRRKAGFC